ncbi:MAG: nucleoside 2-deoxyribosyltransferase domain-containing protein [Phaeodactylibacter sp.]|nr:nucleoside 2-deoxyribosyltransferase domain-containing protein [Phaeodactylibacter sp.]
MHVITAPEPIHSTSQSPRIFLAGSIEQDLAERWQDRVIQALSHLDVTLLNPRRSAWDASWAQEKSNPQFFEQVSWELDALEQATHILMYIDPNTKAPITLLELGLHARSGKVLLCCPQGYWRKGNVDIVCARFGIPQYDTLDKLIDGLQQQL